MTDYSPGQLAQLWLRHGGSKASAVVAVAIAWAESGGNSNAHSPSNDYGLWQINAIWSPLALGGAAALYNPDINAAYAVRISGAGANFAAWCTMWADPARDCGHGQITAPQFFSAAWNTYPYVLAVLGNAYPVPSSSSSGPLDNARSQWDSLAEYVRRGAPEQWGGITWARANNRDARKRML